MPTFGRITIVPAMPGPSQHGKIKSLDTIYFRSDAIVQEIRSHVADAGGNLTYACATDGSIRIDYRMFGLDTLPEKTREYFQRLEDTGGKVSVEESPVEKDFQM